MAVSMVYLTMNKELDVRDNVAIAAAIEKKQETKYVLIGNKNCGACTTFVPVVTKATKTADTEVYYMDTDDTDNFEFLDEQNIKGTPTLLKLDSNNTVLARYEGVLSLEDTEFILKGGDLS